MELLNCTECKHSILGHFDTSGDLLKGCCFGWDDDTRKPDGCKCPGYRVYRKVKEKRMEITLKELRNTHPMTTVSMVEALEDFIDECNSGVYEGDCDCIDCTKDDYGSELIDNLGVRIK